MSEQSNEEPEDSSGSEAKATELNAVRLKSHSCVWAIWAIVQFT